MGQGNEVLHRLRRRRARAAGLASPPLRGKCGHGAAKRLIRLVRLLAVPGLGALALTAAAGCQGGRPTLSDKGPHRATQPWPMLKHDPSRTGQTVLRGPHSPRVLWALSALGSAGSSPAVGRGGRVYYRTGPETAGTGGPRTYGRLYAVDRHGGLLWGFSVGLPLNFEGSGRLPPSSPIEAPDGTIYFGAEDGRLYALLHDGRRKWVYQTRGPVRSSPCVGPDGAVYFGSDDKRLYAVSGLNGRLRWAFAADGAIRASPALAKDGTVYFGTVGEDGGSLYAISSAGKRKWRFRASWIYTTPTVGPDGTVYFGTQMDAFLALRPNGTLKWRLPVDAAPGDPAVAADGTVYFGGFSTLCAVAPTGRVKWRFKTQGQVSSSPALDSRGTVYVGSSGSVPPGWQPGYPLRPEKRLYAIRPDGSKAWDLATRGPVYSLAIGQRATLYFGCGDGKLYAVGER